MKRVLLGLILCVGMLSFASTAQAMKPYEAFCLFSGCGGVSEDGTRAVFPFNESLTDGPGPNFQVYERFSGITRELVEFPKGKRRPVKLLAVSDDAKRVFVETRSPLTADDVDGFGEDAFRIEGGKATLVTAIPGDPASYASRKTYQFEEISSSGDQAFFIQSKISQQHYCLEYWQWTDESFGPLPTDCDNDRWGGISLDGGSIFTHDSWYDVTRHRGTERTIITNYPRTGISNCSHSSEYADSSRDGNAVLIKTNTPISSEDVDYAYDSYLRKTDGTYVLVSAGTEGPTSPPGGYCTYSMEEDAIGLSDDGTHALFGTRSSLVPEDTDSSTDVYLFREGQPARLVTTGPTDTSPEERNPAYASPGAGPMFMAGWNIDASDGFETIAFDSNQRLTAEDQDSSTDVYAWIDGAVQLISTGPASKGAEIPAKLLGVSGNGARVAFSTTEAMNQLDTDDVIDLYVRTIAAGSSDRSAGAVISRKVKKRRTELLSAESVAPKMKLPARARTGKGRSLKVRLVCPKTEKTGPCRGVVRIGSGKGRFSIATGKSKLVTVKLRKRRMTGRKWNPRASLRASDLLGNTARSSRRITVKG